MKVRTSILFLLVIAVILAVLPSIRGIAAGWTPAGSVTPTAGTAPGDHVETTTFALG